VAYELLPGLAVGAAANVMYATLEYALGESLGMPARDMSTAYGWGATLGVAYRPVAWLTLGAAYETRSRFEDFSFNVPPHTVLTPGGPVAVPGGVEKLRFDHPSVAAAGVSVAPAEGLLLAADVELIRWSETFGDGEPAFQSDPGATGAQPMDCRWSDQWVVKVGAEYAAASWLRLRAGWAYGAQPLDPDRALESIAFAVIAEHHLTAGVGLELGKAAIQLAAWWAPEVELSGSSPAQGIPSYQTRVMEYALDAGVSYRF
jgi:long-chain fatty acid transport protein